MAHQPKRANSPLLTNLIYLAELALLYNAAILIAVTLNLDWAKPRAAAFPIDLRTDPRPAVAPRPQNRLKFIDNTRPST